MLTATFVLSAQDGQYAGLDEGALVDNFGGADLFITNGASGDKRLVFHS